MTAMRIINLLLITTVILLAMSGSARADATADAAKADEQARAYFKVGAFEDAAKEFARAYA